MIDAILERLAAGDFAVFSPMMFTAWGRQSHNTGSARSSTSAATEASTEPAGETSQQPKTSGATA